MGGFLAVGGHVLINLGVNLMKLAHVRKREGERAPLRLTWQLGALSFFGGTACNFVALSLTAQAIVSAIGSLQFVSNVVFARVLLHERVTLRVIAATLLILSADFTLVLSSTHAADPRTVSDLLNLFKQPPFIVYLATTLSTSALLAVLRPRISAKLQPPAYAVSSASVGALSVLFAKCLSTLLRATIAGDNQLTHWFLYIVFLSMVLTQFFWLGRLNKGLGMFDALTIVPTMQICWTLFSLTEGLIYFREYRTFSSVPQVLTFIGCVAVIMLGVYLLAPSKKEQEQKQQQQQQHQVEQRCQVVHHEAEFCHHTREPLLEDYEVVVDEEMHTPSMPRTAAERVYENSPVTVSEDKADLAVNSSGNGNAIAEQRLNRRVWHWWPQKRKVAAEQPDDGGVYSTQQSLYKIFSNEGEQKQSTLEESRIAYLLKSQSQPPGSATTERAELEHEDDAERFVHEQQQHHRQQQHMIQSYGVPLLEHAIVPPTRQSDSQQQQQSAPPTPASVEQLRETADEQVTEQASRNRVRSARTPTHSHERKQSFLAYSPAETLAVDLPLDLRCLLGARNADGRNALPLTQQQYRQEVEQQASTSEQMGNAMQQNAAQTEHAVAELDAAELGDGRASTTPNAHVRRHSRSSR